MSRTPLLYNAHILEHQPYTESPYSVNTNIRARSLSSESLLSLRNAKRHRADSDLSNLTLTPLSTREQPDYWHPSQTPAYQGPTPLATPPAATRSACLTAKALAKIKASRALASRQNSFCGGEVPSASAPPCPEVLEAPSATKDRFVAGLVGASVIAIESIWGPQVGGEEGATAQAEAGVLPLHFFVREVLRRSRTSCSTLQVALFYLHKSRREIRDSVARADETLHRLRERDVLVEHVAAEGEAMPVDEDAYPSPPLTPVESTTERFAELEAATSRSNPILCGRRMFLASLIAASKFLQDRNYSNRAWAKISGLPVVEINDNERAFLGLMKFQLHLGADDFSKWTERLATLANQGAALEASAAAPSSDRVSASRMGLSRHATEYPPAAPLQDLRSRGTIPARALQLGRSYSHPELHPLAYVSTSSVPAASRRTSPLRQTATPMVTPLASPTETEVSSASSGSSNPSPRPDMPNWLGARRVLPLPHGRTGHEVPVGFGRVPCATASSTGEARPWLRAGVSSA